MAVFVAAVDTGNFAKAAGRLRISPPAVTRAVAALEGRLGARLFNRTTRRLMLTEVGARFLESSRRLLAEFDEAEKAAVGEAAAPQGHLGIAASVTFGREVLAPVVAAFLAGYPRLSASVFLHDRVVNLIEEGLDVAVRIGDLPDSTLMSRRLGTVRRLLVASPAYLARRGLLKTPLDLVAHDVIAFTALMPGREWRYDEGGVDRRVAVRPRLEINDAASAIAAAEAGEGITVALSYMVAQKIRDGRLAIVLPRHLPAPVPVQLIYPQSRLVAPKVRAFLDFADPKLRSALLDLEV
jgi:DNA-binding transcriptional LysR family regulator